MISAPGKIAIVIVTFNRSGYLQDLLVSAAAMETDPHAIVVVDNASTDDTQDVLASAATSFPAGMLINHQLKTNTGGSGGFSEGTRVALEQGADWVWLMDDDVEILPDALEQFAPWMERFKVIHGRRYDFDGTPFYWQAKFNEFLGVPLPYSGKQFNREGFAVTNSGHVRRHADQRRHRPRDRPCPTRASSSRGTTPRTPGSPRSTPRSSTSTRSCSSASVSRSRSTSASVISTTAAPLFRFHVIRNRAYRRQVLQGVRQAQSLRLRARHGADVRQGDLPPDRRPAHAQGFRRPGPRIPRQPGAVA